MVEGHVIGRLDGFTFAPDASAGGSEAKALQAAARSALAGEIEARAQQAGAGAATREFVLAIRRHAALDRRRRSASSIAGDDVLRPRVRIIADEQLTGAPRDAVQARLDLWLKTHIEQLLGPLFALAAAEDVTGIARGIAFQLVEALGVLERQKVAEDVKGLDQPARATLAQIRRALRRLSHLPAGAAQAGAAQPRGAALGAQARAARRPRASTSLQQLAASGRTSIPVDKDDAQGALPHRRLSRLRRARDPRRHPGAARRPHPAGAGLARRLAPARSRPARSTAAASPSPAR